MKAGGIECPTCHAAVDAMCNAKDTSETLNQSGYHVSRVRRAHYVTLAERSARRTQRTAGTVLATAARRGG